MFKKNLFLLILAVVLFNIPMSAMEVAQEMQNRPEEMQMSEADVKSCKKCKVIKKCLNVCGAVTASSFITPSGALFNGLRNYAVLSNQSVLVTGQTVPFAATTAGNFSTGITNAAGLITLPATGVFLVQYSVRVSLDATDATALEVATAQLQQGTALVQAPIGRAAITSNTTSIGTIETNNIFQTQISGYALVTATSAANNVISLVVTFDDGYSIPPATAGTDANAQMTILQLN